MHDDTMITYYFKVFSNGLNVVVGNFNPVMRSKRIYFNTIKMDMVFLINITEFF